MNIFEFAMNMEHDGREYYLKHADEQDVPALRDILLDLAKDEQKHYSIFKAMRDGAITEYKESEKTQILSTVKNVFQTMKDSGMDFRFSGDAQKVWAYASDVEQKSENFYREKAAEVSDDKERQILTRIADEEHLHWITIQNVMQFLEKPKYWLEDAEWSNLDEG